jgi:hypothetical protein
MAAVSALRPFPTATGCSASTLRGGIAAIRLPHLVSERMLADVMQVNAAWLAIDIRGVGESTGVVIDQLEAAVVRSRRPVNRTCAVASGKPEAAIATFASLEDACQAKLFLDAGFGPGWQPAIRPAW